MSTWSLLIEKGLFVYVLWGLINLGVDLMILFRITTLFVFVFFHFF